MQAYVTYSVICADTSICPYQLACCPPYFHYSKVSNFVNAISWKIFRYFALAFCALLPSQKHPTLSREVLYLYFILSPAARSLQPSQSSGRERVRENLGAATGPHSVK